MVNNLSSACNDAGQNRVEKVYIVLTSTVLLITKFVSSSFMAKNLLVSMYVQYVAATTQSVDHV